MTAEELCAALAARHFVHAPVLMVMAHPDDETIAAGASLRLLRRLTIVHVTDGAPRNLQDAAAHGFGSASEYAAARRLELAAALRIGDIEAECSCLGIADQDASYRLAGIAARLSDLVRRIRPACVVTHAYEGGHPDHDATAFAVHRACGWAVPVVEVPLYHGGLHGEFRAGEFLPGPASVEIALNVDEQARKQAMYDAFVSQSAVLAAFDVTREWFRVAPAYDWSRPPPGAACVYYDAFDWGISGQAWRARAASC